MLPRHLPILATPTPAVDCRACLQEGRTPWTALSPDETACVDKHKWVRTFPPGAVIFEQGMPCAGLHCIQSGLVGLRRVDEMGRAVMVRVVPARQTLGAAAYFSGGSFELSAYALTRCVVCMIPSTSLEPVLAGNPAQLRQLLSEMAGTVHDLETGILRLGTLPLRARVAQVLLDFCTVLGTRSVDGKTVVQLPLSRMRLAEMVGARPESLTRTLASLESEGIAEFFGRRVVIADLARLQAEVAPAHA